MNGKLAKRLRRAALGLTLTLEQVGVKMNKRDIAVIENRQLKLSEKSFRSIYQELKQTK